jgi:hypothetical protein
MKQAHKDTLIFWALILVKALTTLRTGLDTYAVSGDVLNVLLVDGAFLTFWLIAAYGGKGASSIALRPFAAGGAVALYIIMLLIGWTAHPGVVAVAVRVAGGLALGYDISDYLLTAWGFLTTKRKRRLLNVDSLAERLEAKEKRRAYHSAARAMRENYETYAVNDMRARLLMPAVPDVLEGELVEDVQLPPSTTLTKVDEHLLTVAEQALYQRQFKAADVAEWAGVSRQYANTIIKEAKSRKLARPTKQRGLYVWTGNGHREVTHD